MPSPAEFLDSINRLPVLVLAAGMLLLLGGGHWLVEGAAAVARRVGLSTVFVGLTIVAFGTSAPELFFNVIAAASGSAGLSFGNVVGSNIANIALVLGLAALIRPLVVHSRVVRIELPQLIVVSTALVLLAWLPPTRVPVEDGSPLAGFTRGDGIALLVGFLIFATLCVKAGMHIEEDPLGAEVEAETAALPDRPLFLAILMIVGGLAALTLGGKVAETGAIGVAIDFGVPPEVVGLTIVAFATSLPEVITSIIAVRRGHTDLAVGNVVGSNLFNILLVLGATTTIADVPLPATWGWWDLGIMLAVTLLLVPMVALSGRRLARWHGLFLLACYATYIAFTVVRDRGGG